MTASSLETVFHENDVMDVNWFLLYWMENYWDFKCILKHLLIYSQKHGSTKYILKNTTTTLNMSETKLLIKEPPYKICKRLRNLCFKVYGNVIGCFINYIHFKVDFFKWECIGFYSFSLSLLLLYMFYT